jgi:bacteriochlorophyllide a dehydrogenase
METLAVVINAPECLQIERLALTAPSNDDVVVDIAWTGISSGTERLLWHGTMPPFPGMGYPLVPGYESVGTIVSANGKLAPRIGQTVFVPGANCFGPVRGLFGGAAARLIVPSDRVVAIDSSLEDRGVLLALAATAHHAIAGGLPDLIVGHGVLGRLIARLVLAKGGHAPIVWETDSRRTAGSDGYTVRHPDEDPRRDYKCICDASGDSSLLDTLIARIAPGGEIILAGFYADRLSFNFPPAFMREARIRVAAQWQPADLTEAVRLVHEGRLALDGLVTHHMPADRAADAYRIAFDNPACLKMILDWRDNS